MPFSHSVRLAVKASELAVDSHAFVYWPEEGTVSVLAKRKIMEGEAKPGRECKVRVGKTIHPAVIVRTGTSTIFHILLRKLRMYTLLILWSSVIITFVLYLLLYYCVPSLYNICINSFVA